jgi:hypothetical protein
MTLRGLDESLMQTLKEMARQQGISLNALALRMIREASGFDKRKRTATYHDLDSLAGTWTVEDEQEFYAATSDFEKVDADLWH